MGQLSTTRLVELLGATVGEGPAREAVALALKAMGMADVSELDQARTIHVLDALVEAGSVVGMAARLLRIRAEAAFDKLAAEPHPSP
jgi:hypothetical protein